MIQLSSVYKKFSSATILNDISVSFNRKELFFICGPSGSGKTTLLNVIGGLQKPDSGTVMYDNTDLFSLSEQQRNIFRAATIGYLFQFHYLIEDYTSIENIMMPLLVNKIDHKAACSKAIALLDRFDIHDIADTKAGDLSGGQKQKISFLRAIVNEPDVLICDEPTGNLDSRSSEEYMRFIGEFHEKKHGIVIVVTHNKDIFQYVNTAYKVIELCDGKIVSEK